MNGYGIALTVGIGIIIASVLRHQTVPTVELIVWPILIGSIVELYRAAMRTL